MNRITARRLILLPLLMAALASCTKVPITGRWQTNLLDSSEMNAMSATHYGDFLKENKLSANAAQTALVKKVGLRIQAATEAYFESQGQSDYLNGYDWQFNLIESDQVNAWCMPGGRIVVYTGLLPITKTEAGLAAVMGHEVAHAIARHGNERMSQGLIVQLGVDALETAMTEQPAATKDLFMTAFGAGARVGAILPYNRLRESEADRIGLIFMAIAGYDPHEAAVVWRRMAELEKGADLPPEFLRTHPSSEKRAAECERLAEEEAMKYYKPEAKPAPSP